jgi:hypothetical protein
LLTISQSLAHQPRLACQRSDSYPLTNNWRADEPLPIVAVDQLTIVQNLMRLHTQCKVFIFPILPSQNLTATSQTEQIGLALLIVTIIGAF